MTEQRAFFPGRWRNYFAAAYAGPETANRNNDEAVALGPITERSALLSAAARPELIIFID
jgi:hypothetical protein